MFGKKYMTPPSLPKAININTKANNNKLPEKEPYPCYENHYNIIDNDICPMHKLRQQQQCCFQLKVIGTPLYTDNMLVIKNAFHHQIDNDDWEKTSVLRLQQPVSSINNNYDFQQVYCTNHRVTFQKGNPSNTLPSIQQKPTMLASTTIIDIPSVEKPYCLLIKSQSEDDNNKNTPVQDPLFLKLNIDILEHIFQLLDRTALIRCASTCRIWCSFFLEWHYFWKVIKNDPIVIAESNTDSNFDQHRILKEPSTRIGLLVEKILYRKKIEQLTYYDDIDDQRISSKNDEEEYTNEIISLMMDTNYTQLNSILKGCLAVVVNQTTSFISKDLSTMTNIDPTMISKALISSSSNLTTIHLHRCNTIPPEIVLGEILDKCSSLLELSYRQQHEMQQQHSNVYDTNTKAHCTNSTSINTLCSFSKRNRSALRKLWIDLGNNNSYGTAGAAGKRTKMHYFLPNVVQKCPNLQLLVWNPADYANHNTIFESVNQYCSYIQWMITTTAATNITNDIINEDYNNNQQAQSMGAILFDDFTQNHYIPPSSGKLHQGLIRFDIFNSIINISKEALDNIFKKHATTIKTIYLPYNGKSRIFWKVLNAMIENPLINLRHVFFVGTTISFFDSPTKTTTSMTMSSSNSPPYHRTTTSSSITRSDINSSLDFQSAMIKLVSSWKKLESISLDGYYSEMDKRVCMTRDILKQLLFQCKKLNLVSFAHCFETIHEFINGLRTLSMTPTAIRDLTLDCGLLVSFINRYNIEEYLNSGVLQNLQVLRVAHVPDASVANPCFCQFSATFYRLVSIRKILNNRGGDVLYSSSKRAFVIV